MAKLHAVTHLAAHIISLAYFLSAVCPSAAIYCEGPPSAGCTNGMWNEEECKCQCIPPYCPDIYGACASIGSCPSENPWSGCTKGVDCPWWINPLKSEACTTGPMIPPGIWDIYNTVDDCCRINYPYSNVCIPKDLKPATKSPTPYPTISAPEAPDTQIIPVRFAAMQLPMDVDVDEFREKIRDILKVILVRLSNKYESLKVLNVEARKNRRELLSVNAIDEGGVGERSESVDSVSRVGQSTRLGAYSSRMLQRDVDEMIFDVEIARVEGIDFKTIIYQEIQDSGDYIMDEIRAWRPSLGSAFNVCILMSGEDASRCKDAAMTVKVTGPPTRSPTKPSPNSPGTSSPTDRPTRQPQENQQTVVSRSENKEIEEENSSSGLPAWVIVLIVICILLMLCCLCGLAFYMRTQKESYTERNVVENNVLVKKKGASEDSDSDSDDSDDSSDDEETKTTNQSKMVARQMLMPPPPNYYPPQNPNPYYPQQQQQQQQIYQFSVGEDASSAASSAASSSRPDPSMYSIVPSSKKSRKSTKRKSSRDPTVYFIENGSAQDPAEDGRSYYGGDDPSVYAPSVRGGMEPSVYYGGSAAQDPSVYHPSVAGGDDPSVAYYGQDASQYGGGSYYTHDMMSMMSGEQSMYSHYTQEQPSATDTKPAKESRKSKKSNKKKKDGKKKSQSKSTASSSPSEKTKENPKSGGASFATIDS